MAIEKFDDKYRFLSNFWPAAVVMEGDTYPSVEHAYQAAKTLDPIARLQIRQAPTANAAKRLGKKVILRDQWDTLKLRVMTDLVAQKFKNLDLKNRLLATGDEDIIEGNWWGDTFWGVCKGTGTNHLGKILMDLRKDLKG